MGKELAIDGVAPRALGVDTGGDTRTASEAVVEAVAETAGVDPLEVEPLYAAIDPDALDALFGRRPNGVERAGAIAVTFPLSGYEVTVRSDGPVRVSEASSEPTGE